MQGGGPAESTRRAGVRRLSIGADCAVWRGEVLGGDMAAFGRDAHQFTCDLRWREQVVHATRPHGALWHVGLFRRPEILGDDDSPLVLDGLERGGAVRIEPREDDRYGPLLPVVRKGLQKD